LRSYHFVSRSFQALAEAAQPINGAWIPAPRDYVAGLDRQRSIMEHAHPVFLDGTWKSDGTGFGDYYLRALAYKWPHARQFVLLTALLSCLLKRGSCRAWRVPLIVLLPVALVVGVASASGMQLGIRYVLPAFPLLYLFAGQVGSWLQVGPRLTG